MVQFRSTLLMFPLGAVDSVCGIPLADEVPST
jgi:hypothetical protein